VAEERTINPLFGKVATAFMERFKVQSKVKIASKTASHLALEFVCGAAAAQEALKDGCYDPKAANLSLLAFLVSTRGAIELKECADLWAKQKPI